jgi:hypothetical protein
VFQNVQLVATALVMETELWELTYVYIFIMMKREDFLADVCVEVIVVWFLVFTDLIDCCNLAKDKFQMTNRRSFCSESMCWDLLKPSVCRVYESLVVLVFFTSVILCASHLAFISELHVWQILDSELLRVMQSQQAAVALRCVKLLPESRPTDSNKLAT